MNGAGREGEFFAVSSFLTSTNNIAPIVHVRLRFNLTTFRCYLRASLLWPGGGHSYNQLAILAYNMVSVVI